MFACCASNIVFSTFYKIFDNLEYIMCFEYFSLNNIIHDKYPTFKNMKNAMSWFVRSDKITNSNRAKVQARIDSNG